MSLSLMRFMVKADAKLGFVPYDTLLNKKLEVSYRSIEAAFRRCDSLNGLPVGGTARAQQAQTSVDGKAPEPEPIDLTCRVNDTAHNHRGYHYEDRFNRTYHLNPGWQTITIPLEEIRNAPRQRPMQMEAIDNFAIFAIRLTRPRTIYIDNVRLHRSF